MALIRSMRRLVPTLFFILFSCEFMSQEEIVFEYTGNVETYIVPACVNQLNVIVKGAKGGGINGGNGATLSGIIDVTEGQILEIRVGGIGNCPDGGFNGGGSGGLADVSENYGCGGGGASDIRFAPYSLNERIVVAAGGGGMGGGSTDAAAGIGGCDNGGNGDSPFGIGGFGGSQINSGTGGPPWIDQGNIGGNGNLSQGGIGASDPCYNLGPGGGGGGGYFAGGGGGSDCWDLVPLGGGGGGGGSSLVPLGFTCEAGNVTGNGSIVISPIGELYIEATPNPSSICLGDSALISFSGANEYLSNQYGNFTDIDSVIYVSPIQNTSYLIIGNTGICSDTLEVFVNISESYNIDNSYNLCVGESFVLPDGSLASSPGTYTVDLQTTVSGCDSVITTNLSYLDTSLTSFTYNICEGDSIMLANGEFIDEEGVFVSIYDAYNGCDSTLVEEVFMSPSYNLIYEFDVCDDNSYILPDGSIPSESGEYTFSFDTYNGCDSLITINLQINPQFEIYIVEEICQGDEFILPDGQIVTNEGEYTSEYLTQSGCDSIVITNLVVNDLPIIDLGLEEHYCPYETNIEVSPEPPGGNLVGLTINDDVLQLENAEPGLYNISYSYTDQNGCTNELDHEYEVVEPLYPSMNYEITCNELFFESFTDNVNEYNWFLGEDLVSIQSNFEITFYDYGNYNLELIVSDLYGCEYSILEEIYLSETVDLSNFFIPNVITPNQDNINDVLELPSNFTSCLNFSIKVYNKWGLLVYEMTDETRPFEGKNSDETLLPEGVYFYTLEVVNYPCNETSELRDWCTGSISVFR